MNKFYICIKTLYYSNLRRFTFVYLLIYSYLHLDLIFVNLLFTFVNVILQVIL